jgi:hypothetical protein
MQKLYLNEKGSEIMGYDETAHKMNVSGFLELTTAKFNAPGEQLILMSVSDKGWLVVLNTGSVGFSTTA